MLTSFLVILGALQLSEPRDTLLVRIATAAASLEVVLIEELRLGTLEGSESESFGQISGVVADESGIIYIADSQAPAVRRFGSDGKLLGSIGGRGEGPGEFQQIAGVALLPSGELAVWDPGLLRVSVFGDDGIFLRSFPIEMRVIVGGAGLRFLADQRGHLLIRTAAEVPDFSATGPREATVAWLRYGQRGGFIDSIIPPRRNIGGVLGAFIIETTSVPSPLGYLVTGRNDRYALSRPLPDGRVVRIEVAADPAPFESDERRQWEAFVEEWDRRWSHDSPELPAVKPVWRNLFVDIDGRIWINRYAPAVRHPGYRSLASERGGWPAVEWLQPTVYDVIDPRGSFVGKITLGIGSEVVFARGRSVWVLEQGEFDEQYVVRYRMQAERN